MTKGFLAKINPLFYGTERVSLIFFFFRNSLLLDIKQGCDMYLPSKFTVVYYLPHEGSMCARVQLSYVLCKYVQQSISVENKYAQQSM